MLDGFISFFRTANASCTAHSFTLAEKSTTGSTNGRKLTVEPREPAFFLSRTGIHSFRKPSYLDDTP